MSCTYTVGQHTSDCDHFTYHCLVSQQKRFQSPVSNYMKQLRLMEYNDQRRIYVHRNQRRLAQTVWLQSTHLNRKCIVLYKHNVLFIHSSNCSWRCTWVGTLIVATIYLQLIQNRYMFRKFYCPPV